MLIPLSTDRAGRRRAIVNEALIVINLLVYLVGAAGTWLEWWPQYAFLLWGWYNPHDVHAWQLITYQFIHDPYGVTHILFNLLFLWVFGNAVENRLGHLGYLGFYLIGGAVAGIVHGMIDQSPVIGASGSISAVTGAFLALFPRATIRVFGFFFYIGIYHVPAAWFILFYFAMDLLRQTAGFFGGGGGGVAYAAHLAGYVYGFLVAFALLGLRILPRQETDVFFLFKQMRRRQVFRSVVEKSNRRVWDQPQADSAEEIGRRKTAKALSDKQREYAEERAEITRLLAVHELVQAASRYRDLLRREPEAVMPEQRQLDLANQFFHESDVEFAKRAYELFLARYATSRSADQVRLVLALIYTRKLRRLERARELLAELQTRPLSESERSLADELRAEAV